MADSSAWMGSRGSSVLILSLISLHFLGIGVLGSGTFQLLMYDHMYLCHFKEKALIYVSQDVTI